MYIYTCCPFHLQANDESALAVSSNALVEIQTIRSKFSKQQNDYKSLDCSI